MKLYEISKKNVLVKYTDGKDSKPFLFHHLDGMYSYCTDLHGNVFHPAAWTDVEIVEMFPKENKDE